MIRGTTALVALITLLAVPVVTRAQANLWDLDEAAIRTLSETRDGEAFGISEAETSSYSAYAFQGFNSGLNYYGFFHGYRYVSNTDGGTVIADLPAGTDIPLGALIGSVCVSVYDQSTTGEVTAELWQSEQPANAAGASWWRKLGDTESTGVSWDGSYDTLCVVPLHVMTTWADINGDGKWGTTSYNVRVEFTKGGVELEHGGFTVLWQRQLSPAPATASFTDVPTGHWAFRYVEALVDSGITAGCGGGNFCPDSTLTRAQMAVFLSKALGLHFTH